LGFRGREDLGGGTAAFFTAEFGLSPTDATLSGNSAGGLFNRQTFVGLSQKGVGQFAIGTQNTPIHNAVGRTDPGQVNNIAGNVIYAVNTGSGEAQSTLAYTVRLNQALTVQSERMAGFQINALYNNSNSSSAAAPTQTGTPTGDNVAYGAGINYVLNKFNLDLAYQNLKNTTFAAQGGSSAAAAFPSFQNAFSGTTFSPMNPFGTANSQAQMYAGAVYDFGMLKAYAQFIDSKIQSNLNGNNFVQRTAQQIGVRGNFTPKIEGWASAGNGRLTAGANQAVTLTTIGVSQNFTGYQVGANYILSKRTNLYGIFGSTQVSSSSISATESRAAYGLGVRHTF